MALCKSIKTRILIVSISLAVIPVIVVSIVLGMQATGAADEALEEQVENQLVSIREIKKGQVENYLRNLEKQIKSYSIDAANVIYAQKLNTYYNSDRKSLTDVGDQKQSLQDFYNGQYATTYKLWNAGTASQTSALVDSLDNIGIALQNSFLAVNDSPFGEKHHLINPEDGTSYANAHEESHRVLKNMYGKLAISDMYIVNPKGDVVYSVQKYPDFATNLNTGAYKDSNLAKAYQTAIASEDYAFVAISDVQPYAGNFNQPAMFIASPIQDLDEEDAFEILGVMVFKIDLTQIDSIMSSDAGWEKVGMGQTGDAYLVGPDMTLRSNPRQLIADKAAYLESLQKLNVDASVRRTIELQSSAIARVQSENPSIKTALAGDSGAALVNTATGLSELVAYTPLKFKTLNWAIVSSIDADEAFAAKTALANRIKWIGIILSALMVGIAVLVGTLFATMITRPLIKASRTMTEIEQTSDLTRRIDVQSKDEIGTMANAMNNMLEKFRNSMERVAVSTTTLATSSEEMSAITQQTGENINKQFLEIDKVATAINELTATVQEVSNNASSAAHAAMQANEHSADSRRIVETNIQSIEDLSNELASVSETIDSLSSASENIGTVIDVIKSIAEQTNLLALNAAIEAARAGEQGRGFAVVADEVRTLASRTQKSTGEIESMIEQLQKGAQQAVQAVSASREKSQQSVTHAASAGDAIATVTSSINEINDMNTLIANAAQEQSTVTDEINRNITTIRMAAEQSTQGAEETTTSSEELSRLAADLQHLVAEFKTS